MPAAEPLQPPNTDHALFHQAPNNSGFLSQWYDGPDPDGHFTVDNRRYSSAEQAMIDFKALYFGDRTALGPIMATTDPATIHTAVPGDGRRATGACDYDLDGAFYDQVRSTLLREERIGDRGPGRWARGASLAVGEARA